MGQFFAEYGLFLLKVITIVAAIVVVVVVAASAGRRASHEGLEVENLNKNFRSLADSLRAAISTKEQKKRAAKARKKEEKAESKSPSTKPRSFVIDFKGRPEGQRGTVAARGGQCDSRCDCRRR